MNTLITQSTERLRRPSLTRYVLEGPQFIFAEVVGQNVHVKKTSGGVFYPVCFAQVTAERLQLTVRMIPPNSLDRLGYSLL